MAVAAIPKSCRAVLILINGSCLVGIQTHCFGVIYLLNITCKLKKGAQVLVHAVTATPPISAIQ